MVDRDVSHTIFSVDNKIYHYTVVRFGFINVGATYQRMVNKPFVDMIGNTMEAYADDMLVKSKQGVDHKGDVEREFS